jgi:hypothetical protein
LPSYYRVGTAQDVSKSPLISIERQRAEGRRQRVEGRRQRAEGRGQRGQRAEKF